MPAADAPDPSAGAAALAAALGAAYAVERELGGGGMSRVYLATEVALGRPVVVKVLPPELAASVDAERFRREIQLAARLQHPHIVPLLTAGTAGALLYYTMPFVAGRSLRDRLAADGALPTGEALRVAREVAGALAYAHRHGVVHRDVKPENVLLSDGHALVTDFGIAKALGRGASPGDAPPDAPPNDVRRATQLTGLGFSIGTPAYMAPEQAVGDPSTDHRADWYAFGVLAYELFAGRTPFADRSGHELLVAHMVEAPPPLAEQRPDAPTLVAALVMQCLAKRPEDRPQSGEEVVRALDAVVGGASTGGRPAPGPVAPHVTPATPVPAPTATSPLAAQRSPHVLGLAIGAAALVAGAAVWWAAGRPGAERRADAAPAVATRADPAPAQPADRVLVLPFDDETADPALAPVGRMAADWLTQGLAQTGVVKVVDAKTALILAADAGGAGAAQRRTPLALARSAGAGTVVTGSVYKLGDSVQFQAQVIDGRTGDVLTALDPVRGAARDPLPAIDQLRQRALGALAGRLDPRLGGLARATGRPPLYPAYQAFVEGMERWTRTGDPGGSTPMFRRATELDSTYAQAWLFYANGLFNQERLREADAVVTRVDGMRTRLSPLERALLDIFLAGRRNDRAADLEARRAAAAAAPNSEWSWILVEGLARSGRLHEALDSLARVPGDLNFLRNSPARPEYEAAIRHRLGDYAGELAAARAAQPRFPDDATLRAREVAALAALGRVDEARTRLDALVRLSGDPRSDLASVLHDLALDLAWHGQPALARLAGERELVFRERYLADSAGVPRIQRQLAESYYALGRWDDAARVLAPLAARDTSVETQGLVALVAARRGDTTTAARLTARFAAQREPPYSAGRRLRLRASVAAVLGRRDEMLARLREMAERGLGLAWMLHADPDFAPYQRDPDFRALTSPTG